MYRNNLPKATSSYVRKQQLIAISILFYAVFWAGNAGAVVTTTVTSYYWVIFTTMGMFCIAKTSQYAVFMIRLHSVYSSTPFAYAMWKKYAVVIVGFLGVFSLFVLLGYHTLSANYTIHEMTEFGPTDAMHPSYGIPYVLCEFAVNVVQVIMMTVPLIKTYREFENLNKGDSANCRRLYKLKFVGSEFFVIGATSSVTTLFAFFGFAAYGSVALSVLNTVSDAVCLILISPYFSGPSPCSEERKNQENHWWYFTLCRPSIYCCYCCGTCFTPGKWSLEYLEKKKAEAKPVEVPPRTPQSKTRDSRTWDTMMSVPRKMAEKYDPASTAVSSTGKHQEMRSESATEVATPAMTPPPDSTAKLPDINVVASGSEMQSDDGNADETVVGDAGGAKTPSEE